MTYLEECEPLVEHQSKKETWDDQEQVPEGVFEMLENVNVFCGDVEQEMSSGQTYRKQM